NICKKPDLTKLSLHNSKVHSSFYLFPTTSLEIETVIERTCSKPAPGIDEINSKVSKSVKSLLAPHLSHLINKSFLQGIYLESLKISKSIPIYKGKGSEKDTTNYRNLCLQSQIAKIFEQCDNTRLTKFLELNKVLNPCQ